MATDRGRGRTTDSDGYVHPEDCRCHACAGRETPCGLPAPHQGGSDPAHVCGLVQHDDDVHACAACPSTWTGRARTFCACSRPPQGGELHSVPCPLFGIDHPPSSGRGRTCGAQTYWYDSGVQRARFCGQPATRVTQALDGSRNHACDAHAASAIEAGARDVTGDASGQPSAQEVP